MVPSLKQPLQRGLLSQTQTPWPINDSDFNSWHGTTSDFLFNLIARRLSGYHDPKAI